MEMVLIINRETTEAFGDLARSKIVLQSIMVEEKGFTASRYL